LAIGNPYVHGSTPCSPDDEMDDEMIGTATKKAASSVEVRGMPGTPHEVLAPLTPDAFCGWMEAA